MNSNLKFALLGLAGLLGLIPLTVLILWLAGSTVDGQTAVFEKELGNISVESVRLGNRTTRHTYIDGAKYHIASQIAVPSCRRTKAILAITPVSNPFTGKGTYNELVEAICLYNVDPTKKFP